MGCYRITLDQRCPSGSPLLFLLHQVKPTNSLGLLEEFFCAELEDIIQFLLGHGGTFVAESGPHHQMSQHHLLLGNLSNPLLN